MTEAQRLFLTQARSDFAVFELLRRQRNVSACHPLHYLQMSTELFGKARAWRHGPNRTSHRAFVGFLRSLSSNRQAQHRLGYAGRNQNWTHLIRKSIPLAERIENLAPALNPDAPNPEYPWPRENPHAAPVEYRFDIWLDLQETSAGRQFLRFLQGLFASAEVFI